MTPTATISYADMPLETLIALVRPPAEAWFNFAQMMALGEVIRRAREGDEAKLTFVPPGGAVAEPPK